MLFCGGIYSGYMVRPEKDVVHRLLDCAKDTGVESDGQIWHVKSGTSREPAFCFMAISLDLWTLTFWGSREMSIGPTKSYSLFAEGSTATKLGVWFSASFAMPIFKER